MTITSYWPTHTNLTPITTTRDRFVGYKVFIFAIVCKLRLVTPELSPDKFIDFVDILEEEYKTVPIDTMVFWGTCSFLMIIHRPILVLSTD